MLQITIQRIRFLNVIFIASLLELRLPGLNISHDRWSGEEWMPVHDQTTQFGNSRFLLEDGALGASGSDRQGVTPIHPKLHD